VRLTPPPPKKVFESKRQSLDVSSTQPSRGAVAFVVSRVIVPSVAFCLLLFDALHLTAPLNLIPNVLSAIQLAAFAAVCAIFAFAPPHTGAVALTARAFRVVAVIAAGSLLIRYLIILDYTRVALEGAAVSTNATGLLAGIDPAALGDVPQLYVLPDTALFSASLLFVKVYSKYRHAELGEAVKNKALLVSARIAGLLQRPVICTPPPPSLILHFFLISPADVTLFFASVAGAASLRAVTVVGFFFALILLAAFNARPSSRAVAPLAFGFASVVSIARYLATVASVGSVSLCANPPPVVGWLGFPCQPDPRPPPPIALLAPDVAVVAAVALAAALRRFAAVAECEEGGVPLVDVPMRLLSYFYLHSSVAIVLVALAVVASTHLSVLNICYLAVFIALFIARRTSKYPSP
jgi:hypothetical protein